MRFFAGFVTALVLVAILAVLVIFTGAYNVAASVPHSKLEFTILHMTMRSSVIARAGTESREAWSDAEVRDGFKDFDEMCIICHAAPGKELRSIGKGMRPQPPNLADAVKRWTDAQLFWIIKNGVKMTGMPAFGLTHNDNQIWNIVGFVRQLPKISADEFAKMERDLSQSREHQGESSH